MQSVTKKVTLLILVLHWRIPTFDNCISSSFYLTNNFFCGLCWLDPVGTKHHNNLNVVRKVSLAELDALEILEKTPIHTVSSIVVSQEDQLTKVVNLLCDSVTRLWTNHDNVITNLASVVASASGGCIFSCSYHHQHYQ